jgi:CRP-like cAMP-binding protein
MSLSVACNRFHGVEKRLARWLLMMQDRAQVDEFRFTQELISRMIGTRRPHVSTAVRNLHSTGVIHNGRGKIDILDRDGLTKIACACYLAAKKRFDGLFST